MKTRIASAWKRLAQREKIAVALCMAVVIAGAMARGIIFPMLDEKKRLETEAPRLREEAVIAQRMAEQIGILTKALGAVQPEHYGADDLLHALSESSSALEMSLAITRSTGANSAIEATGTAPLPILLAWLEQTRWKEGLGILSMNITANPQTPNSVSATIILSRR